MFESQLYPNIVGVNLKKTWASLFMLKSLTNVLILLEPTIPDNFLNKKDRFVASELLLSLTRNFN